MAGRSRYEVSAKDAGLVNGLLKNKLGINDQDELDDAESLLLADTNAYFFEKLEKEDLTFDLPFLFDIHRYFLEPLYTWAGKLRRVNISKGETLFAPVEFLEDSLELFSRELMERIPGSQDSKKVLAEKLAFVHNELNVIHPFREGNGRVVRLFLDLMIARVGYHPVDWGKTPQQTYIEACQAGFVQDHRPMEKIIYRGLKKR